MIFLALTLPGLIVAYWLFVRPLLRALPQLKEFYARADGFWQTVWALCGKSITMAFSYFVQFVGWCCQAIEPVGDLLGDPNLKDQITEGLQANPTILGYILMGISFITIAARLHGIAKRVEE